MFAKRERATGRRPSKQEMDEAEEDEHTGSWHPEPCEEYFHSQPNKDLRQFLKEKNQIPMFGELQFSCRLWMFT